MEKKMNGNVRIFSFVGSLAGKKSHTKRISDMLADAVKEKAAEAGTDFMYYRLKEPCSFRGWKNIP